MAQTPGASLGCHYGLARRQGTFSEQYWDSFGLAGGCISAGPRDKDRDGYVGLDYAPGQAST